MIATPSPNAKGRIFLAAPGFIRSLEIPSGRAPSSGLGPGGLLGLRGDHGLDHVTKSLSGGLCPRSAAFLSRFAKPVDRKVAGKPAKRRRNRPLKNWNSYS